MFFMVHVWDIIKNVPSAVSFESRDEVGIYPIVSLFREEERSGKWYVTSGVPIAIWFGI